jgi:hypothetical protein
MFGYSAPEIFLALIRATNQSAGLWMNNRAQWFTPQNDAATHSESKAFARHLKSR